MPLASAEAPTSTWFPAQEELLKRPTHPTTFPNSLAIDPPGAYEFDGSINVEEIGVDTFRIYRHTADAGLLHGQPAVDVARQRGWTVYYDDGTADEMLDRDIFETLGVNNPRKIGTPVLSVVFEGRFDRDEGTFKIGTPDVGYGLVKSEAITYKTFRRRFNNEDPQASAIARVAGYLAGKGDRGLSKFSFSECVEEQFSRVTNTAMASEMERAGLPWLFRTQTSEAYQFWQNAEQRELLQAMRIALYNGRAFKHRSMGDIPYCHMTAPLRRFPDLANHLNLRAHKFDEEIPYDHSDMAEIARELTALFIERSPHFSELVA